MSNILKRIRASKIVQVFFYLPYLYFILSVIFSQIALNAMNVVLIFLIFLITSSNFSVSIIVLTFVIPQIFLSFIGGVVADIKDKKSILVYGNLLRAFILLTLFLSNTSSIVIYIVSLFVSIVTQFYLPAETPLIPKLVGKQYLTAANSLFGISLFGSILIGYVLAGPVLRIFGRSYVFVVLSILFLISSLFVQLIPTKLVLNKKKHDSLYIFDRLQGFIKTEFKRTYLLLRGIDGVFDAFFLLGFSQIIILVLAAIVPGYAKTILEIPVEDLSFFLFSPAAIGMIIASFLIGGIWSKKNKYKMMTIGIFISGCIFLLFPFTSKIVSKSYVSLINSFLPGFVDITILHIIVVVSFLAGFANALIFVPSQTIIQDKIPEVFRSKVYGLLFALIGVLSLLPVILTGWVADLLGVGTVFFGIGAFIVCIGLARLSIIPIKAIRPRW